MSELACLFLVQTGENSKLSGVHASELRFLLPEFEISRFNSATTLLAELRRSEKSLSIVYLEQNSEGISNLNVCDAVRSSFPNASVIIRAELESEDFYDRAMLAGAQAVVPSSCTADDIAKIAARVASTRITSAEAQMATDIFTSSNPELSHENHQGNIVCFMGARGGAGRSVCSSLTALTLARQGYKVALVDLDLQYGDLGLLFNASQNSNLLDYVQMHKLSKANNQDLAFEVEDNLSLFSASYSGDLDVLLAEGLKPALNSIANDHDIVICNTGAFWRRVHAGLLDMCNLIVCVSDQTVVGARTSTEFLKNLEELSFPLNRCLVLINKFQLQGLSLNDFKARFALSQVLGITKGGEEFSLLSESGNPGQIFKEDTSVKDDFLELCRVIVFEIGLPISGVHTLVADFERKERKRWFQWV